MLLPKTLNAMQFDKYEKISATLVDSLKSDGLNISLLDIVFGEYFIYTMIENGILAPIFLYEHELSHKVYQSYGAPKLHFCNCTQIRQDFSPESKQYTLVHRHYLARITKKNAFTYSIKQGLSQIGLYNEYPLDLCPMCSDMLSNMRDGAILNSTIGVFVFENRLSLLEQNQALREKEMLALQMANIPCYKCQKQIDLNTPIWFKLSDEKLLVSCC